MKAILLVLTLLSAVNMSFGKEELSHIPIDSYENSMHQISIDPAVVEKYQSASKFFKKATPHETQLVTYETLDTGVNCHVGWYSDGYIVTALNGSEAGKQVVFVKGNIVGISYDVQFREDYFIHKYTWGIVYSYSKSQRVVFN